MLFWKDVGNRILLDRPLPFKLHQSYRPLPRFIREFNPASQEIWPGPAGEPRECRPLPHTSTGYIDTPVGGDK